MSGQETDFKGKNLVWFENAAIIMSNILTSETKEFGQCQDKRLILKGKIWFGLKMRHLLGHTS